MSFFTSIIRRAKSRISTIEDGIPNSTAMTTTTTNSATHFASAPTHIGESITIVETEQLQTFRLISGISSSRSLDSSPALPIFSSSSRPAPNIGIYGRVVHRESVAKRSYKLTSALISGCLGLQIIVAAALTAMGAANSNHKAITAFGAINTIMAGLLTFLKGSGFPNKFRFHQNEWRKVREFIEQREREFSRPGCTHDVLQVISVIEAMYEEVRADVETSGSENYVSAGDLRNRATAINPVPKFAGMMHDKSHGLVDKLGEFEAKYGEKLKSFASEVEHKIHEKEKNLETKLENEVATGRKAVDEVKQDVRVHHEEIHEAARDIETYAKNRLDSFSKPDPGAPGITISISPTSRMSPDSEKTHHHPHS